MKNWQSMGLDHAGTIEHFDRTSAMGLERSVRKKISLRRMNSCHQAR